MFECTMAVTTLSNTPGTLTSSPTLQVLDKPLAAGRPQQIPAPGRVPTGNQQVNCKKAVQRVKKIFLINPQLQNELHAGGWRVRMKLYFRFSE